MTLKLHKVAQLRRVELTSSGSQAQKVTTTYYQVPSPFSSKGKSEDGVNLFFGSIQKVMPYENKIGKNQVKKRK